MFTVIGNDKIKAQLETSINTGTVSHGYIFSGKKGVGKYTLAKEFGNVLTNGNIYDIIDVNNERYNIDKKVLSVETIRCARDEAYQKPNGDGKRVFIIDNADSMQAAAQNALLKIFEEPPEYIVFILIAENYNSLLPTIKSRAIKFNFVPLTVGQLQRLLPDADPMVLEISGGSVDTAIKLSTQEDTVAFTDEFYGVLKGFETKNPSSIFSIINFIDTNKKDIDLIFEIMHICFRNAMLGKEGHLQLSNISQKAAIFALEEIEKSKKSLAFNTTFNLCIKELIIDIWEEING